MGLSLEYNEGQTPLDEDEKEGLIPSITTREELDVLEHHNIQQAMLWVYKMKTTQEQILTEVFVKRLHKRMYNAVWQWVGQFRKTDKNLGVAWWQINIELKQLLDDTHYWINNKIFDEDEIAIRFKHRLVSIHCFPNGNGRHSRLMADIMISKIFKHSVFSWGAKNLTEANLARQAYIKALQKADRNSYSALIEFART
jgi:Fic-DOC domain mobile mystery protein B